MDAERLEEMLGGQVQQARDLQAETLRSLEKAAAAFQAIAQDVGKASAAAAPSTSPASTRARAH